MLCFFMCQVNFLFAQEEKHCFLDKDTEVIVFNSVGEIILFPNSVIRDKDNICFEVRVPLKVIQNEIQKFISDIREVKVFFNPDSSHIKNYSCYFEGGFTKYIEDINAVDSILRNPFNLYLNMPNNINRILGSYDNIPIEYFFNNLLLNQFKVVNSNSVTCSDTVNLIPKYSVSDSCFIFKNCIPIESFLCSNCENADKYQLGFKLISTDPYLQTIKDWIFHQNSWFILNDKDPSDFNSPISEMAKAATPNDMILQDNHVKFAELKPWLLGWLWFTGGKLTFNPFDEYIQKDYTDVENEIRFRQDTINKLLLQKEFLKKVLDSLPVEINKLASFKIIQDSIGAISNRILKYEEKNSDLKESILKPLNIQRIKYLNDFSIQISSSQKTRVQSQLNASNGFKHVASTKKDYYNAIEIPDNVSGYISIHNVESSLVIKLIQKKSEFKDSEEFTKWLSTQLGQLKLDQVSNPTIERLEEFVSSFDFIANLYGFGFDSLSMDTCFENTFDNPIFKDIINISRDYVLYKRNIIYSDKILIQSTISPDFRTVSEQIIYNFQAPFTDSISILKIKDNKESKVAETHFNVGKLVFAQVSLGFALTSRPVTITNIDTSSNGFLVSESDNSAKAIVGIKLYPWQHYSRDRWLVPKYPLHRINVFGGFELLHPEQNIYLGLGYDIVPGLNVSFGKNYYLQTKYRVENNTITGTSRYYESKGIYYGLSLNPIIFIEFVKLFFKAI